MDHTGSGLSPVDGPGDFIVRREAARWWRWLFATLYFPIVFGIYLSYDDIAVSPPAAGIPAARQECHRFCVRGYRVSRHL
jgi:hypothetical protein